MNESADIWFDRARLKIKLTFWRSLAIIAVTALVGFLLWQQGLLAGGTSPSGNIIARVNISGIINDDIARDTLLKNLAKNPRVKAVILRLDTPGGTTVGGEELYESLKKISKHKPVISVMRTVCASACYMAALGTDYVIARETSIPAAAHLTCVEASKGEIADVANAYWYLEATPVLLQMIAAKAEETWIGGAE